MQIKKRAKSARFGKKTAPANEVKEEKKELAVNKEQAVIKEAAVEQSNQTQVSVKSENEEIKAVPAVAGAINGDPKANISEKNIEQIGKEEVHVINEGVQAPVVQNQQSYKEPQVSTIVGQKPVINENVYNDEVQIKEEGSHIQIAQNNNIRNESGVKTEMKQEPEKNENVYVVQTEIKKNMVRYFIIIAVISFLVGLITMAGVSFVLQRKSFELPFGLKKTVNITPSPKPTLKIEPTKTQLINLAEYSIEILNGSELAGAASRLRTALKTEGFEILSTGNADNSEYTDTIISKKKDVKSLYIEKLRKELEKKYILGNDFKTALPEDSEADVIITIGSKIASGSAQN